MTTRTARRLFIIDASIFIFRYYFSMPARWQASNGRPTETVYGYTAWLLKFLEDLEPDNVVACFDESLGSCFRNEIYPEYKSSRAMPDDDLAFQLLACKKMTEQMGVSCYASDIYEADDLIGSFAKLCHKKQLPYTILSRDKDLGQLVLSDDALLWDYPDASPLGVQEIFDKFGVFPHQIADYLALVGDVGDDIPGVPGVGSKTASALLKHFGDWKTIKNNIDDIESLSVRGAKSLGKKILAYSDQIDMSLKLSTIVTDTIPVSWRDTKKSRPDKLGMLRLAKELGFPTNFNKKMEQYVQ